MMSDLTEIRQLLHAYEAARIHDGQGGEANNAGNVAGDALADALAPFLAQLTEDINPNAPVWVPEFNEDGSPAMDDRMVVPHQKHHVEWRKLRRWVTDWEEISERITSEQLSERLSRGVDA